MMVSTEDAVSAHSLVEDCSNITFSPPLYRQRYELAADILRKAKVTSVCLDLLITIL